MRIYTPYIILIFSLLAIYVMGAAHATYKPNSDQLFEQVQMYWQKFLDNDFKFLDTKLRRLYVERGQLSGDARIQNWMNIKTILKGMMFHIVIFNKNRAYNVFARERSERSNLLCLTLETATPALRVHSDGLTALSCF